MIQKLIIFFLCIVSIISLTAHPSYAASPPSTQVILFYSPTCPHCAKAQEFLDTLKKKHPSFILKRYAISQEPNRLLQFYREYRVPQKSQGLVPIMFIGKKYYLGFNETIAKEIEGCITSTPPSPCPAEEKLSLPFLGELDTQKHALPLIAILLGALDGFNVCSLGALLIILALVLALKSRAKTLLFGGTFIATTALIYGMLIFFWYQLFTLISPYMRQMELVISLLTFGGGVYFLREFIKFQKQGPTCEMGAAQKMEGSFAKKFQSLLEQKAKTLSLIASILLFAVIITILEFPCSAAVPVAFASILSKAQLPGWLYVIYIAIYVLFYMIDELVVFLIAFFSMKLWMASPKFIVWITLAESLLLFTLGAYYFFGLL